MPMIRSRSFNTLWLSWSFVAVVVSTIVVSVVEYVWPDIPDWINETLSLGTLGAVLFLGMRSGRPLSRLHRLLVHGLPRALVALVSIEVLAAVLLDQVALLWMALVTAVIAMIAMVMFRLMRAMRSEGAQDE